VVSARGDLERLAALLIAQGAAVGPLLVPAALEPAGDLPALLRGRVEAKALPVYQAVETAAAAPAAFDAVLIHSARAARALAALGPFSGQTAVALSAAAAAPPRRRNLSATAPASKSASPGRPMKPPSSRRLAIPRAAYKERLSRGRAPSPAPRPL